MSVPCIHGVGVFIACNFWFELLQYRGFCETDLITRDHCLCRNCRTLPIWKFCATQVSRMCRVIIVSWVKILEPKAWCASLCHARSRCWLFWIECSFNRMEVRVCVMTCPSNLQALQSNTEITVRTGLGKDCGASSGKWKDGLGAE